MEIMLKIAVLTFAFAFLASTTVLAKDQNDDVHDNVDLLRGSHSWFMSESVEHTIGQLNRSNPAVSEQLTEVKVTIDTARTTTKVELRTATLSETSTCRMVEHVSKSGTRLKKEVVCQ